MLYIYARIRTIRNRILFYRTFVMFVIFIIEHDLSDVRRAAAVVVTTLVQIPTLIVA